MKKDSDTGDFLWILQKSEDIWVDCFYFFAEQYVHLLFSVAK